MEFFNEIARELNNNTNKVIGQALSTTGLTLGTIKSTGLKLDNFKYEIKNYLVLEHLKMKNEYNTEASGENPHKHILKTPQELKALDDGDRVLVALLGNEFVVVGRVVNA
ncbi:hypothetical protein 10S11_34 [uncultured Caudovirales phage]|uniref:Uncharacterized protein n=1 Tax=uncultured Caudovirales phage TaxID=2100421 RepID=A0A2H4J746_9CAUD|nr:hypothetical protein 10S11_34 [uncultured Caudovirales phage]